MRGRPSECRSSGEAVRCEISPPGANDVTTSGIKPTKVTVERAGGFGGIRRRYEVDTGSLPENVASRIRQLVDAPSFFDLPERAGDAAAGADRMEYTVTVEAAGRSHTVRVSEGSELSDLIELVSDLATGADPRRESS